MCLMVSKETSDKVTKTLKKKKEITAYKVYLIESKKLKSPAGAHYVAAKDQSKFGAIISSHGTVKSNRKSAALLKKEQFYSQGYFYVEKGIYVHLSKKMLMTWH